MNCLYGVFGRKKDVQQCVNVQGIDLNKYLSNYVVTNIIDLGNDKYTLVISNNISSSYITTPNVINLNDDNG